MDTNHSRTAFIVELLGSFALVFVSAGVVCINQVTLPSGSEAGQAHLHAHQPGLVGIALAQGLILAAMLSITLPHSPGCLNPAIVLMYWVTGKLATARMAALLVAQIAGGVLAGACLRFSFENAVLASAHFGTPHLNDLTYGSLTRPGLVTGTLIELVLTFFLVLVILSALRDGPRTAAWAGGLALTALAFVGFPLTGAALNPTRWFGTVFWEFATPLSDRTVSPLSDVFVYAAGPVVGALLAGIVDSRILMPAPTIPSGEASKTADPAKAGRVKK
jgi:aquaporin Z